jgi:hypothetical protein
MVKRDDEKVATVIVDGQSYRVSMAELKGVVMTIMLHPEQVAARRGGERGERDGDD